jgi:amidase
MPSRQPLAQGPRISRDIVHYAYDRSAPVRLTVTSGTAVTVETHDARAGALLDRRPGESFILPRATPGRGNPLTGPIAVDGAQPGDALVVGIKRIELVGPGWCGAHAHVGPLRPGRIPEPLGRLCAIDDQRVLFSEHVALPAAAMIGCIGTAPDDAAPSSGLPGRYGGNMDHPILSVGATVHLPVFVPGGLLFLGDVHACQGDGELSGVAVEIAADVTVTINLRQEVGLRWPWAENDHRIAVLTTAMTFDEARAEAVEAMMTALESQLGLRPAEALALISIAGDLRIGQAFGGMEMTLRLEMPASLGLRPPRPR